MKHRPSNGGGKSGFPHEFSDYACMDSFHVHSRRRDRMKWNCDKFNELIVIAAAVVVVLIGLYM